jgi:broad specificity phosphatase PhoE
VTSGSDTTRQTTVLLVRHAEVHNPRLVLYGRLPRFRLSDAGLRDAGLLAERLADRPVAAIYSSPLLRARQTAEAIATHHPDAARHRSTLLHEVGSAWQGRPFASFPPGFNTFDNHIDDSDESMAAIRDRMLRFVRRCAVRHPGQTVVAVSHGDPITILRVSLLGVPLTVPAIRGDIYAPLGSITEITIGSHDGGMTMSLLDDDSV